MTGIKFFPEKAPSVQLLPTNQRLRIAVALRLTIVYVPVFNPIFKTQPLAPTELAITIGLPALVVARRGIREVAGQKGTDFSGLRIEGFRIQGTGIHISAGIAALSPDDPHLISSSGTLVRCSTLLVVDPSSKPATIPRP